MSTRTENILVVGPSWVGDMVMSQVLYQFLAQSRPGATIDVLAPAWSGPLLQRMPGVRKALTMPLGHGELGLRRRWQLGGELREQHYGQALLLPNSLKSALVPWFAGIPLRTGWRGEMRYGLVNDLRLLDEQALPLMVQRFLALGLAPDEPLPQSLPTPQLRAEPEQAMALARRFALVPEQAVLALCPGAEFGGAKRWPIAHYAELARHYLQQGWQVVLYGSANDQSVTAQIKAQCDDHAHCIDLAGRTQLVEALDLLSLSAAVVSNDSGLMHIAAALQLPLVVVYGATSPGFTPPLSEHAVALVSSIDCAPCFSRECPLGHHRCMEDTSPQRVLEALKPLLAKASG